MSGNTQRYQNLEGLRGLAALIVVLWHFSIAFLPFLVGFAVVARHTPIDKFVTNSPLFLPVAGSFAVLVFFVLSGFVLSLSFFKRKDHQVLAAAASRRYFRLMIPALGSVIFAYIIMKIGSNAHSLTAQTTGSPWLTFFWNFDPHLGEALRQGSFGAFFNNQNSYNTNLWTMYVELIGSFIVFGILAFFGKLERRWVAYLALAIIFAHSWYLAFLLGIVISDIWVNYPHLKDKITPKIAWGFLIAGIILGSIHYSYNVYGSFYAHLRLPFFTLTGTEQFLRTIAAGLVIVSVLRLDWLSRFFELKPLQYLGKISFSLYLIHFAVIYSFSCIVFNILYPHIGYIGSVVATFIVSMPVIFAISHYYAKYVDAGSIVLSKKIGNWLLADRPARATKPQVAEDPAQTGRTVSTPELALGD